MEEEAYCKARPLPRSSVFLVMHLRHNSPITGNFRRLFRYFLRLLPGEACRIIGRTALPAGRLLFRRSSRRAHVMNKRRPCPEFVVKGSVPRNGMQRPSGRVSNSRLQQETCGRLRRDVRRPLHAIERSLTSRLANKQASYSSPHCVQIRNKISTAKTTQKQSSYLKHSSQQIHDSISNQREKPARNSST
jgi:hypothetical protein